MEEEEAILMAPFPAKLEKHDAFTKLKQLVSLAATHAYAVSRVADTIPGPNRNGSF